VSFDLRRQNKTILGQNTEFLIGELLLKAGVIKQHQLDEALKLAGNKHMQIGQMLIMARYIKQKDLQVALDAQVALRDRILDMNAALRAISVAHRSNITFAEASQNQSQDTGLLPSHKLGQLLLEANLIGPEQLSIAVQKSMATGLPVGRILILNNVITDAILAAALEVLIKMRDGNVVREEAIAYLANGVRNKAINDLGVAVLEEASIFNSQPVLSTRKSMRLGEFLVLAEILSETDIMNALEFSLVADKPLGESLLEHGYITREIMDSALKLQSLVESDTLDQQKAAQSLHIIHVESLSLSEALERVTSAVPDGSQFEFSALLVEANLLTINDIKAALDLAASNPRILAQILSQTGYLAPEQSDILVECHDAITQNLISQHDAKFVLDFCLQKLADSPITFTEGLQELGWSKSEESIEQSPIIEPAAPPVAEPQYIASPSQPPQGSFLGTTLPGSSNQSFIPNVGPEVASQNPELSKKEKHTGRTTSNMPAITNLQAGSELHLSPTEKSETLDMVTSQHNNLSSDNASSPKANSTRGNQAFSLKSLLKEEHPGQHIAEGTEPAAAGHNDVIDKKDEAEGLALSASEKDLIIKASSLTASPQEIMAAMKLAAEKEKSIQSPDKAEDKK
jgi:hypothetical protein